MTENERDELKRLHKANKDSRKSKRSIFEYLFIKWTLRWIEQL
jgi:hypothetical protein